MVAKFDAAPCSHDAFAARQKINVGTFRHWLYRLRAGKPRATHRSVPKFVEVVAAKPEPGCTLTAEGIELRFDHLPTPEYLAELLSRAAR